MPTLLELRNRCKQESDNVGQSFLTDAEWNTNINSSYQEIYGLLAQKFGADYFIQSPTAGYTFTTDGINNLFALPAAFFKLAGVDLLVSGAQYIALKPFAFTDRNRFSVTSSTVPAAGQTIRVFYIPRVTLLAADGDSTVDAINMAGWDEYIVADVCIKALTKEESDPSVFMARKAALIERIESEAANRDAGSPATIVDVFGRRARGMQYRVYGSYLWLIGGAQTWAPFADYGFDFDQGFGGWGP